ncbi:hypothetical protein MHU86_20605 [Fragilaria crotonensis]|nr:hypothetical protein MHU86_20605 [Fragilaria crotonensis]
MVPSGLLQRCEERYVCKYLKPFKFEDVWNILKENLVKFQIPSDVMDSRVQRALFFCDDDNNDNAGACAGTDKSEEAGRHATAIFAAPVQRFIPAGIGMYTTPHNGEKEDEGCRVRQSKQQEEHHQQEAEIGRRSVEE